MNLDVIIIGIVAFTVTLISAFFFIRRRPRKLDTTLFMSEWKSLQGLCRDKDAWPIAISEADRMLDKALKKRRFKGKSMGERMVSAQRLMTNNDSMWFAHNLYKKLAADPNTKLKEAEVKSALVGFRQALKDLGALDSGEPQNS